jgi:predicted permease
MSVVEVFYRVILPIFLIIGAGSLMDFYVFVPALAFVSLLKAEIAGATALQVAIFAVIHAFVLYFLCRLAVARWQSRETNMVLILGTMFFNCGNYGFPLVAIAFGESYLSVAAVILMVQNLLSFTFGVWLFEKEARRGARVVIGLLKIPVVYAVSIPFLMRWLDVELIGPIQRSLDYLSDGLIPVALLTLGAQLSRSVGAKNILPILTLSGLRLAVSPLIAAGILLAPFFQFSGADTAVLVVMAGLPVAVNVYILASQYGKGEALASQSVFWTTLLSAVTVSILLTLHH